MTSYVDVAYLTHAFQPGARLRSSAQVAAAEPIKVAALNLPTGAVVVADPFVQPDAAALSLRVTPGRYPVLLSLLREPGSFFTTVAAAMLRLAEGAAEVGAGDQSNAPRGSAPG